MSSDPFAQYRHRYETGNAAEKEAILKALQWFASRPWNPTVPDWVRALGITPGSAAPAVAAVHKPPTWAALVAMFTSSSSGASPTARSPKGWAAADTLIGRSASGLIVGARLSVIQQRVALDVVWPLVLAADAIESELAPGATHTAAYDAWLGDLASVNALIADLDGGAATGSTPYELTQRLAIVRSTPDLGAGKAALAHSISVPTKPSLDSALIDAAEAVRLFFT